jgi:hypothetical protein
LSCLQRRLIAIFSDVLGLSAEGTLSCLQGGGVSLCHNSCFVSKVVDFGSTENQKLDVLLFRGTTKTNLFVLVSDKTSFISSFGCSDMNRVS